MLCFLEDLYSIYVTVFAAVELWLYCGGHYPSCVYTDAFVNTRSVLLEDDHMVACVMKACFHFENIIAFCTALPWSWPLW